MTTSLPDGTVHLSALDAHRLDTWLDGGRRTVIVPAGALEQHGPHLPLGTDALLSGRIAAAVAQRVGALVAPTFSFGYKSQQRSGGGDHLVGTTSLDAQTLVHLTRDVVGSLLRQGVRQVVVLNGHYENYQFLYEGVDLALRDLHRRAPAARPDVTGGDTDADDEPCVLLLSYWDYVSAASLAVVYGDAFPGWDVEHGGVLETSLMLHLEPGSVWPDRAQDHPPAQLPRFDRLPVVAERTPASGCLSAPTGSSAEHGRLLFEQVVQDLADDLITELGLQP